MIKLILLKPFIGEAFHQLTNSYLDLLEKIFSVYVIFDCQFFQQLWILLVILRSFSLLISGFIILLQESSVVFICLFVF